MDRPIRLLFVARDARAAARFRDQLAAASDATYEIVDVDSVDAVQRAMAHSAAQEESGIGADTQRAILAALPAHVALLDATGSILVVNEAWRVFARDNAYASLDLGVGRDYLAICETAEGESAEEAPAVAEGLRAVLAGSLPSFAIEYPCPSPSQPRWFRLTATPVSTEHRKGAVVMHVDITERRLSLAALAQQAALLDTAHDAIFVRDLDRVITYWNKGAERLYGWTAAEALGRRFDELLQPDRGSTREAEREVHSSGRWSGEIEKVARDGRVLTLEGSWTLVRDSQGQPKSILTIDSDITERKRIEEQFLRAQRLESIGLLARGIAHDLNNALAPIAMSIAVLKIGETDPRRLSILSTLELSARRGGEMVGQVLSFARGVGGQRSQIVVSSLVSAVSTIANDTFLKTIRIRTSVPDGLWNVAGDPTQLHQVLLNLAVNARDAMPSGGLLMIMARNVELDEAQAALEVDGKVGRYVVIQLEDTGTGMSKPVLDKIFDPFFTTKVPGTGTGLGLSTSHAIVKAHGGFIRVDSEPDKGTRFQVFLPAQEAAADEPEVALADLPRGDGELVLVVDDEEPVRELMRQTLEAFGYRVLLAADGSEAATLYAAHREETAVVITDMTMPVMDGAATIEVLRRLNPRVRIIAASGLSIDENLAIAAYGGAGHFLAKPFGAQVLLRTLRQVLHPD